MPLPTYDGDGRPRLATSASGGTVNRTPASIATKAALIALAAADAARVHGNEVLVDEDGSRWSFHRTSTAADASQNLVLTPTYGTGRWLRVPGTIDLVLDVAFGTADLAVLFTVPVGARLILGRGYWDVDTAFTGGSSSSIGLAGPSPHNTAGDLLGGSGGDVAATLTAGVKLGTIGADTASGVLLKAADTVVFNRITSAFTAGAGRARFVAHLLRNPGA
ncbi:MAG: hypothetical protein U0324_29190 [Polyangiales bacterium]